MLSLATNNQNYVPTGFQVQDFDTAYLKFIKSFREVHREVTVLVREANTVFTRVEDMVISHQKLTGRVRTLHGQLATIAVGLKLIESKVDGIYDQNHFEWVQRKFKVLSDQFRQTTNKLADREIFAAAGICTFIDFGREWKAIRLKGRAIILIRRHMNGRLTAARLTEEERHILTLAAGMSRPVSR